LKHQLIAILILTTLTGCGFSDGTRRQWDTLYHFTGDQVHVTNLNPRNSSHVVVGHRGDTCFTVEGKTRSTSVTDQGRNVVPNGRVDIRIEGNAKLTLTVYWQRPSLTGSSTNDSWIL